MTFRRLTNKVILHSLFKFTHKEIYMVNILRYPDIIKKHIQKEYLLPYMSSLIYH